MPKAKSSNVRKVKVPPNTPERPITFLTKKSDTYTYVYVATNKFYDSVNGYQKNERKCIGRLEYKLEADWKEKNLRPSEMIPNERFVEYFPEYLMIDDTTADSTKESDSQSITEADDNLQRSDSVKVGQYIAINKIIEKLKIKTHLKKCFSNDEEENEASNNPEEVVNRILDFVAYMIIEEDNAAYHFENYAFEHVLFGNPFSDSTIGRLFASIDIDITNAFLKSWNEALIKENKRHETRIYVSADGTNGPCEAGNIELAEYGASKVDDGNPIVGMMLAVELLNKLPIYYDVYYGSINDVSESQYMANALVALGYTDIGFVLDRGFFSIDNIKFFEEKGFAYIIMAKGCKQFIRTDFLSVINTFENKTCNYIQRFMVYGTTKEVEIFGDGKKRYVHFYFNSTKVRSEQQAFMSKLNGWEKSLEKKRAAKEKIDRRTMRYMELYFNIEYSSENVILSYSRNTSEIDNELSLAGYFAIITYDNMTAEMALIIYKSRDVNEKLNMYKTFLGGRSYRVHDDEHLTGKAFVTFIAMIIRQSIYLHLNDAATKEGKEWEYYTVTMAMSELGKISVSRLPNGKYALRRPLTRRQKRILAAFKINEKKVIEICSSKAEELNEKYAEEV